MFRFDDKSHWSVHDGKDYRSRCKMEKCRFFSNWYCEKCQKYLCLTSKRNCFYAYHHSQTADENRKIDRRGCDQIGSFKTTKSQRGKKEIVNKGVAGKQSLERHSREQTVASKKIGCARQSKKTQKEPLPPVVARKQLVRKSKAVNVSADKKVDSSRDKKSHVRDLNKVQFMAVLDLCSQ